MPRQIDPDKALKDKLHELYRMSNIDRATAAKELVEWHRQAMQTFALTRAKAIKLALEQDNITATALAEELGISRQQLYRLMKHDP